MIKLEKIWLYEIGKYIAIAFSGDSKLAEKYHDVNGDISDCIFETTKRIIETDEKMQVDCYKVVLNESPIGFVVTSRVGKLNMLYSFGLSIGHRTKEVKGEWICKIKDLLSNKFISVLWSKNSRAISFLKKSGLIEFSNSNGMTTLITKNMIPCQ